MDRSSRSSTKRQRGKKRKPPRKPRKRKQPRRNKTRFVQTAAHGTGGARHWNTPCPTRLFFRGWRRFPDAFDYPPNCAAILTCQHSTRSAASNPAGGGGIGGHPWCTCRPCSRGYARWSGPGNRRTAVGKSQSERYVLEVDSELSRDRRLSLRYFRLAQRADSVS